MRALRSVALVCRRLQAVALPFLWDRVRLDFFALPVTYGSEEYHLVVAPWSDELLGNICDSGRARHVRELHLSLQTFGSEEYEPTFEHFRRWFPDDYDELWEELRADHLCKLEDMVRNLRDSSMYPTEGDFHSDLRELCSGDACFEQGMYDAWVEYFAIHNLNETDGRVLGYPLSYIPFGDLPALRLIDLGHLFADRDEFEQYCRVWPKALRPRDLTIRTSMDLQHFDSETASALRTWA